MKKIIRSFIRYMRRTWKNKLIAISLLVMSFIPAWLFGEATLFVFLLMICIPLFFANENHIVS